MQGRVGIRAPLGLAAVGAAALVALGGLGAALAGASGVASAATTSTSGSTVMPPPPGGPGWPGGPGGPGGWGPGGPGGPHGRMGPGQGVGGKVASTGGSSFTVQGRKGQTYTVTVGSATTYDFGPGLTATLGSVQAGDQVAVGGTVSGTDVTATLVHIQLPGDRGTVTAVSGNNVSIQEPDGRTATIQLSTAPSVQAGQEVVAAGTWQQDTLVAQGFAVVPPHVDGTVTAVSGDTATVKTFGGQTVTLQWSTATVFRSGPSGTASAGSVVVGAHIHAQGQESGTTFDATQIDVMPAPPSPPQGAPMSPPGN